MAVKTAWSDEELLRIDHEGKVELVNGELLLTRPAGMQEGAVGATIGALLCQHVRKHGLGRAYGAHTGFRPYDNTRAPDVSFVRAERLPGGRSPKGFGHFPPDLAVEVFAPDETAREYREKVEEYFGWGVALVWLVDPESRTVTVCRSPVDRVVLTAEDELTGGDVVPGFTCRVSELFE